METKINNVFIQELRNEPYFPVECGVTNTENEGMLVKVQDSRNSRKTGFLGILLLVRND